MLKLNQLESAHQVSTNKNRHIILQSIIYIYIFMEMWENTFIWRRQFDRDEKRVIKKYFIHV